MYEYLQDTDFLRQLDQLKIQTTYAKIILLSWDERPIKEIQGQITSGNMNVNGSAAVRRTINLTMYSEYQLNDLENLENDIAINKKIKIFVGKANPFKNKYDKIIWFPCGLYILSNANLSRGTQGATINISGKDKMVLLDGSVGGTLPASVTFHEAYTIDEEKNITVSYPTIYQIIKESVHHYGGEPIENIIISDLDLITRLQVKYVGSKPVYFDTEFNDLTFARTEDNLSSYPLEFKYGDDIGYQETDFTYPGELILAAGENVASLLTKIKDRLGNYEFFYDLDGRFRFQEIKNYLNTYSPLDELTIEDYVKNYSNSKFIYSLTGADETVSITKNPNYDNIKNDFIVWGQREADGIVTDIHYRCVIDSKPTLDLATKYFYKTVKDNKVVSYFANDQELENNETTVLIGRPCGEWREELYRQALIASVTANNETYINGDIIYERPVHYRDYDAELLAFWKDLYDTMNDNWKSEKIINGKIVNNYWNPAVFNDPKSLIFWLDFIDDSTAIGKYSVHNIGRRTKVVNEKAIKTIKNPAIPDVIFLNKDEMTDKQFEEKIAAYNAYGQKWFQITDNYKDMFAVSPTWTSAFDMVRELIYLHLCYNTTITVSCLPKYYLEPNNIVYIEDRDSRIAGNYVITSYSLPLSYQGTMSMQLTEVLVRV